MLAANGWRAVPVRRSSALTRRNIDAASPSADFDRRHRSSCVTRFENRKRLSIDAENRRAAPPRVGGRFFLKVSPDLPKALQLDGCSRCRCGVIANAVDGSDGGNVWVKTTERVIVNTEDRTPLPRSGLQKTRPLGGKRNRPHLRWKSDRRRTPPSGGGLLINPPCALQETALHNVLADSRARYGEKEAGSKKSISVFGRSNLEELILLLHV